ncbi:MFS transporter [Pseudomonas gingeri]|uniref:MFS transporter n=1 Tax=Pseudomonas gingeri TaxID=117681 RepID=UPI0015A0408A|nr:MFS transporter [Pseudomonas gingeri]NWD77306.1 MFS transporter [Pseudomonas gingeri]
MNNNSQSAALSLEPHDSRYEWKTVLLLALGFGLVGLDRWILAPLFPSIMDDLHLSYSQLGTLVGALALAWGTFSILIGNVSDRVGRRAILIPALIIFSLLSGLSGMATSFLSLLLVRGIMGAAEGAFCPVSVAATAEASHPRRRGLNQGLQLSTFALFGFGIAPILATQLLAVVPSWREVFMLVALPGLLVAYLLYRVLREPPHLTREARVLAKTVPRAAWIEVLKSRNALLAAACLFCTMSCVFVMGAMVPSYLIDELHLTPGAMGVVLSAMGWGGFLGEFGISGLSDIIGRRKATVLAFIGAALGTWFFFHTPAEGLQLFIWLAVTAFFGLGLASILTGPIPTEAVSPRLTSSAIGFVSGAGEFFGGGIAPVIAGFVAQHFGIGQVYWIPMVGLSLGIFLAFFLRETAPRFASVLQHPEPCAAGSAGR